MAVDTPQKRFSLLGLGSPVPRLLPIPQGSFGAGDRALLIFLYSGIDLGAAVAAAETYSGGWGRPARRWPAEETETERKVRIHAERVKLGIIEPDPVKPAAVERAGAEISAVPATLLWPESPDPGLALDLAELYTGAYLDEEIRRHFALQDLDDEEAMFAILAVVETLH